MKMLLEELVQINHHGLTLEGVLAVPPGATHLFEESGTLEVVARHAAQWFERHLTQKP